MLCHAIYDNIYGQYGMEMMCVKKCCVYNSPVPYYDFYIKNIINT